MTQAKRIKLKKARRNADSGQLALFYYWLAAKQALRERRLREAKARARRRKDQP